MFGIISQQALDSGWGTAWYSYSNPKTGETTQHEVVASTTDASARNFTWTDKVIIPLTRYERLGRPHERRNGQLPRMPERVQS